MDNIYIKHAVKIILSLVFLNVLYACNSEDKEAENTNNITTESNDLYYGGFNGTWEGELYYIVPSLPEFSYVLLTEKSSKRKGMRIRVVVKNQIVKVFSRHKEDWQEIKTGKFSINAHKTNAVIFVNDSSTDIYDKTGIGGWVETWNITLTHKDKKTLYAYWVRADVV